MNSVKSFALILAAVLLSACGFAEKKSAPVITAESLIAQDFVNTMVQIEVLMPWSTVLHFNSVDSGDLKVGTQSNRTTQDFGRALRIAASNSGYAVQNVERAQGTNFVRFSVSENNDAESGLAYTYDVSVGEVDFRRVYKPLAGGRVEPAKAMLVRGADVSNVESDDSIFYRQPTGQADSPLMASNEVAPPAPAAPLGFDSPVARNDAQRRKASDLQQQDFAVTSPTVDKPIVVVEQTASVSAFDTMRPTQTVESVAQNTPAERTDSENSGFSFVRKRNIAELGASNYDSLFSTKQSVAEEVLIFGDDSYVLGSRNKKILGEMMDSFDPATDVISIVGCSTGTTKIANGNAALAIGRANRVKEALLYSGIPHDKIFDEGCWSPTSNSTPFPNRGVVITVKRGVKNG